VEIIWRSYELGPAQGRIPGPTAGEEMAEPGWWEDQAPDRITRIQALEAAEGLGLNLQLDLAAGFPEAQREPVILSHTVADYLRQVSMDLVQQRRYDAYQAVPPRRSTGRSTGSPSHHSPTT
jgi:hypothetical protein